ncbi:TetR/AcrR family transcriptional regulator, partial [Modestobacter versicolor]
DTERVVRVIGALAAVAVLALAADQHDQTTAWRPFVVATCTDALGHRRPGATPSRPDQVEA